jgi:excisionase family DNA binding protein
LEHTENAIGLPLILDALRAVVRDEFGELRRELIPHLATGDDVLTMDAAAKLLRVSSKTVLSCIRKFGLPASKVGVEWRFRRSEVVRWIGEHHVR